MELARWVATCLDSDRIVDELMANEVNKRRDKIEEEYRQTKRMLRESYWRCTNLGAIRYGNHRR